MGPVHIPGRSSIKYPIGILFIRYAENGLGLQDLSYLGHTVFRLKWKIALDYSLESIIFDAWRIVFRRPVQSVTTRRAKVNGIRGVLVDDSTRIFSSMVLVPQLEREPIRVGRERRERVSGEIIVILNSGFSI